MKELNMHTRIDRISAIGMAIEDRLLGWSDAVAANYSVSTGIR
jgi:hypothetical protein